MTRHQEAAAWLGMPADTPLRPEVVDAVCDPDPDLSGWSPELLEQLGHLTHHDRDEILTFAAFMQTLGPAPAGAPLRDRVAP